MAVFQHLGVVDRWPATPKRARYSALKTFSWQEDKYTNNYNTKTAERSFSKLKLSFFRSSMSQERLSGPALLSIENERAENLDFSKVITVSQRKSNTENFQSN